jgi:hypothetical protein
VSRARVSPVAEALRALDGERIPGGCDSCDAYQVVVAPTLGHPNVAVLNTFHDADCPVLAQMGGDSR